MRLNTVNGGKPERIASAIKNAESSSTISVGQPVVLVANGTDDGLAVVLPSTANSAQKSKGLLFGVALSNIAAGYPGEALVFGFHQSLRILRQTRAASTDVWASEAARSVGEFLSVDTVNNVFVTASSAIGALTVSTGAATVAVGVTNPQAVLMQTLASYASSASSTADTRTAITASVKAFVRMM